MRLFARNLLSVDFDAAPELSGIKTGDQTVDEPRDGCLAAAGITGQNEAFPFGDAERHLLHRFNGIQLPAALELAFQEITSGSGKSKKVLVDFRILQSQPTPKKD